LPNNQQHQLNRSVDCRNTKFQQITLARHWRAGIETTTDDGRLYEAPDIFTDISTWSEARDTGNCQAI